ncbi:hypothetical protein HMPREF9120_00555 [Neisseria sp. oral taxon 020 str. F0370]|nr:hypothetical protein HMPREF9120_00555 [Neisseria sp. oral taxon 020 str. F0370]
MLWRERVGRLKTVKQDSDGLRSCLHLVLRRLLRHKTASAALKILSYGRIRSYFRLAPAAF